MSPVVSDSDRFFSLVSNRECGECMVCCQYLSISAPGLNKPADVLCGNCIINRGCSIYDTRPNVCRTWHCLWRRMESLPDALRPDRSNVIFSLKVSFEPRHVFENAYVVCMALTDPSVFDTPIVSASIDQFIADGSLPVWLSHGGGKSLVWPDKELAEAISLPSMTQALHRIPEGKAWLERFNQMLEPLQDQQSMFGREFLRA